MKGSKDRRQIDQVEMGKKNSKEKHETKRNSLLPFSIGQRPKAHRKRLALLPEVLSRNLRAVSNVRPLAIAQMVLGVRKETRGPEAQQYPRGEEGFPILVRTDSLVH